MTPFTVHDLATAPEGSREALAAVAGAWGFVPQLQGILAESPAALVGYETLFGLVGRSTFTAAEQQVAFLAVSTFNGCEYCTMGHTYLARAAKLPEAEVQRLRAEEAPADPRLAALWRFARAMVEQRGWVGDAAVDAFLAAGFSRANVLDVVAAVAAKTISSYANHIAHTPKEPFMADPALAWTAPRRAIAAE